VIERLAIIVQADSASSSVPARHSALRTLALERDGIAAIEHVLSDPGGPLAAGFEAAVALIRESSGRVIVTGMGKSGHVGRKVAATLASTGTPAYFVHPGEASHGDLGMIQAGDVILALSWSGDTAELADIITYSRRFGVALLAVSANPDSALCREADINLVLPQAEEACPNGLAPTTSTLMQLALGDALSIALLESKGFTARDFHTLHPGGKLGARLTFVRDIMHREERIPLVPLAARMSEAIVEISAKGFGCVGIVGAAGSLEGIITDGDLRRHMRDDLMSAPVVTVMTKTPATISADSLAVEALERLNARKITALFVLDEADRPIGIIHFHDLLRSGAA
jgi:arabinose-5-phosphate isomerase